MLPLVLAYSSSESEPEGVLVNSKFSGITDAFRGKGDFDLRKTSGVWCASSSLWWSANDKRGD